MTPIQLLWELFAPWREAGLVVLLAAAAGLVVLLHRRHAVRGALLAPVAMLLAAVAVVSNPVHVVTGEWLLWLADRFLLPWHFLAALLAAVGLAEVAAALAPRPRRGFLVAAWLLLAAGAAARWERLDHARDYLGFDYAENLRASLPPGCAVLAEADYQCFPLVALRDVEQRMPGMTFVLTNPFLNRGWGWTRLARRLPIASAAAAATTLPLTGRPDAASADRLVALADRLGRDAPVLHLPLCSYAPLRARMRWRGILSTLAAPGAPATIPGEAEIAGRFRRFRLRGLHGRHPWKDDAAFSVLDIYGQARAAPAPAAFIAGRHEEAAAAARRGLAFTGRMGAALLWTSVGHAQARLQRFPEAEAAFRRALALRPRNLDLLTNVATACAAQGRTDEAMRYFQLVLRRDPGNAAVRANLGVLRRQLERVPY